MRLTRRQFMALSAGAAAGVALPQVVAEWVGQAALAETEKMYFFTDATRAATCAAACARIVPTGSDPATDPGATEARAVVFIDRLLAAFELPSNVADGPTFWLSGPASNRNPFADHLTGDPSSSYPADSFYSDGVMHALRDASVQRVALTRAQRIVWWAQLYGASSLPLHDPVMGKWASQVQSGVIPGIVSRGLRQVYASGLDALDGWSKQVTGQPFAEASPPEQDAMLAAAGNVILSAVLPQLPLSSLPVEIAPPAAAQELYPVLVTHTFQACYGLPEYREQDANPLWKLIGYDGDTLPLGNSVYGSEVPGDNAGFGDGVYEITGGYKEYRPVSYISTEDDSALTAAQAEQMVRFLTKAQSR